MWVALADARERFPIPAQALHELVDGGLMDLDRQRYESFDDAARLLRPRRRRSRRRLHRRLRRRPAAARRGPRHRAPADQHHPRRARGLGARACLLAAGRARLLRRHRGRHRRGAADAGLAGADGVPVRPRPRLPRTEGLKLLDYLDVAAPPAWGRSPGSTRRRSSGSRRAGSTSSTARRSLSTPTKLRIVADELPVTTRPRERCRRRWAGGALGRPRARGRRARGRPARGAADARRRRADAAGAGGDPPPPPDNGQHIALGCFEEYARFVARIGKGSALRREPLSLPVIDERGRASTIRPGPAAARLRPPVAVGTPPDRPRHPPPARAEAGRTATRRSRALLRRLGQRQEEIDRFWDVFIRPALNLPTRRGRGRLRDLHRPDRAPRRPRRGRPAPPGGAARRDAR